MTRTRGPHTTGGLRVRVLCENGAGNSTLMKILAGFTARTTGSLRVGGKPA